MSSTSVRCAGCGGELPPLEPRPFRCPRSGHDDVDHLLVRKIEGADDAAFFDPEPNPFVRFRRGTHAWHVARETGMTDAEFVALVRHLDGEVLRVDGRGFVTTPFRRGWDGIWVKNETGNVAGSHKARHLMGLMLWLIVAERLDPLVGRQPLAIASCGNAALAAATVARAAGRHLDVFVPEDASPAVLARIEALGARITRCERRAGERGDPAVLRFREAVAAGALPFTCQGSENGLVVEAGQTLGWEHAVQLAAAHTPVEDLFVQVGGGALASACIAGLEEAHDCGVLAHLPRIHAVQTAAVAPLARAWDLVRVHGLEHAIAHRSQVMWPWEPVRPSLATGILDDETWDWAAVIGGMLRTGGRPVLVSEERLEEANSLARARTGIAVSHTGSAGLAGLLEVRGSGAVIFTG